MLKRLPTFEQVLPPEETEYHDPRALASDEAFTVGERLSALVAWRLQVAGWLRSHNDQLKASAERRELLEQIDACIDPLLQRIRRPEDNEGAARAPERDGSSSKTGGMP